MCPNKDFSEEVHKKIKKLYIPLWNFKKAWFCIENNKFEEALEHIDIDDLNEFYQKGKWTVTLFAGDNKKFKEFKSLLKEKGFNELGLTGHYTQAPYTLFGKELENEYNSLIEQGWENDRLVNKIIDAYREFQNPELTKHFIPKLHNYLKDLKYI